MKKLLTILILSSVFFASSSYLLMAANFSPVYNGIFSTAAAGASPAITFDITQGPGQDYVKTIVFAFPAGFDIKGSDQISNGTLIGSGQLNVVVFGSTMVFPLTIRSYSQNGAKAMWEFNFNNQLIVDALLNGSISAGHTLTFSSNPPVPLSTPLDLNFQIFSGVFTNLVNGGTFAFTADMTSATGLTASSSWTGAIAPPPPGPPPGPPPPPPPPPPPGVTPPPPASPPTPAPTQAPNPVSVSKTAPVVTLDKLTSPTNQAKTLIKGSATFANPVSLTQVSLDGGKNWFSASVISQTGSNLNFEFQTPALQDDNYTVIARVVDNQNLDGLSAPQTLVVDTLPPIVGSNELLLGGANIFPDQNGAIQTSVGESQKIVVSAKGGPTSLTVESGKTSFPLTRIEDSDLWQGEVKFTQAGEFPLTIKGVDGAGNTTERAINPTVVEKSGEVIDQATNQKINAKVTLYTKDQNGEWVRWDGESYSQANPIISEGAYSFFVPAGSYYLKAEAGDYREFVSSEFSLDKAGQVNFQIPMVKRPSFNLFGWDLVLPSWLDFAARVVPVTLKPTLQPRTREATPPSLNNFSLPDQSGANHTLSDYQGEDLVLTFWSTWNLSSPDQLKELAQVKGLQVLPVASQDSQGEVVSYINRGGFGLQSVLIDNNGQIGAVFGVTTAPQHFFINKEGKVKQVRIGVLSAKEIMEIASKLD